MRSRRQEKFLAGNEKISYSESSLSKLPVLGRAFDTDMNNVASRKFGFSFTHCGFVSSLCTEVAEER